MYRQVLQVCGGGGYANPWLPWYFPQTSPGVRQAAPTSTPVASPPPPPPPLRVHQSPAQSVEGSVSGVEDLSVMSDTEGRSGGELETFSSSFRTDVLNALERYSASLTYVRQVPAETLSLAGRALRAMP